LNVIAHILKAHGLEGKIRIRDQEGVEKVKSGLDEELFGKLLEDLPTELKGSDVVAVGVLVDADLDIAARWQSLADRLKGLKYAGVPDAPPAEGVILDGDENLPPFGVWLMPDNTLPGMLEDFIELLVPPERENLWQMAVSAIKAIPPAERPFGDKIAKARIHTYLAWQERPGVPYGIAIREKFLAAKSPQAAGLVAWMRKLYQL
jgi:hypothetical protein